MAKVEANYHEMTSLPEWIAATGGDGAPDNPHPYKWSGVGAPPAIGDVVEVRMNSIGRGTVTSYFAEYGWLGVLVTPHNPPAWYVKQNGRHCAGHVYGAELAPAATGGGSEPTDAIVSGLAEASKAGLAKPFDVALCVTVALKKAGYRIVRTPTRRKA